MAEPTSGGTRRTKLSRISINCWSPTWAQYAKRGRVDTAAADGPRHAMAVLPRNPDGSHSDDAIEMIETGAGNPREFVAETFLGLVHGTQFGNEVLDMYLALGGMPIAGARQRARFKEIQEMFEANERELQELIAEHVAGDGRLRADTM